MHVFFTAYPRRRYVRFVCILYCFTTLGGRERGGTFGGKLLCISSYKLACWSTHTKLSDSHTFWALHVDDDVFAGLYVGVGCGSKDDGPADADESQPCKLEADIFEFAQTFSDEYGEPAYIDTCQLVEEANSGWTQREIHVAV